MWALYAGRKVGAARRTAKPTGKVSMAAPPTTEKRPPAATQAAPPAHHPYVPASSDIPEFTWSAVLAGVILGILFGASSLYLILRVGLTVSASIPIAVLSITLFRL